MKERAIRHSKFTALTDVTGHGVEKHASFK